VPGAIEPSVNNSRSRVATAETAEPDPTELRAALILSVALTGYTGTASRYQIAAASNAVAAFVTYWSTG